jgi:hypothetical protein
MIRPPRMMAVADLPVLVPLPATPTATRGAARRQGFPVGMPYGRTRRRRQWRNFFGPADDRDAKAFEIA